MGTWRKILFSGRALLIVSLCAGLLGWAVLTTVRSGLVWDASGLQLREARSLVAELAPGTRITFFGSSPLIPMLEPLSRGTDRLILSQVDAALLPPLTPHQAVPLQAGDVQIVAGDNWLLLHRPEFDTVLWALGMVSSPYAPTALSAPPGNAVAPPSIPLGEAGRALAWAMSGLALPAAVCLPALWWRRRRSGA
jgi:hypothetical protein